MEFADPPTAATEGRFKSIFPYIIVTTSIQKSTNESLKVFSFIVLKTYLRSVLVTVTF